VLGSSTTQGSTTSASVLGSSTLQGSSTTPTVEAVTVLPVTGSSAGRNSLIGLAMVIAGALCLALEVGVERRMRPKGHHSR
jgi:hypothetical protein